MAEAVVTEAHRKRMAAHMATNASLPPVGYMAFGDGGHNTDLTPKAPSASRTTLVHELLRKPLAVITQEDLYSVTGKGMIEAAELNGAYISEAALMDSAGNMIGYKTFAPKIKEADERYEVSVKLRF
jgi:phage-related tail fiber protein